MKKKRMDRRWPWLVGGVDIEGVVGALVAIIAGLLLGMIWSPLFWLGAAVAIIVLAATRTAERVRPDAPGLITAPCDGVVERIGLATPPLELGLGVDPLLRVRIAASPLSPNGVFAPTAGVLEAVRLEEGERSAMIASKPDIPGLSLMTATLTGADGSIGLHISASGLGPRLQWLVDTGDSVAAGERIGVRRLGGWCDLYLPEGAETDLLAGQTLVGGETPVFHGQTARQAAPRPAATETAESSGPPPEPAQDETTSAASQESALAALQRLRDQARDAG